MRCSRAVLHLVKAPRDRRLAAPTSREPGDEHAVRHRPLSPALLLVARRAGLAPAAQDLQFHAPASRERRRVSSVMRDLAERLLPVYQEPDPDRYLANLSALQMVAGDYVAADAIARIIARTAPTASIPGGRSAGARSTTSTRMPSRSRRRTISVRRGVRKAYEEAIARLSDHDAYAVAGVARGPAARGAGQLPERCSHGSGRSTSSIRTDAVKLVWAYLAYEAYRSFAPLVGLARRQGRRPTLSDR